MPYKVDLGCVGCGRCIDECPLHIISMVDGFAVIDEESCAECGVCYDTCTLNAIRKI